MKRSLTARLMMLLPVSAVLVYFGAQTWRSLTAPILTASVYERRAERTLTLSGFVVRDEALIDCGDAPVELTRAEGERVARGGRIATVYENIDALEAERRADELRDRIEQLRAVQTAPLDAGSVLRRDTEIERGVIALRAAVAGGDYAASDAAVAALEPAVIRRAYAAREHSGLTERVAALEAERADARRAAGSGVRAVTAPFAGTYSAVVDGYESVLTPAALADMTVSDFLSLAPQPVSAAAGRLIRGEVWYYAALISEADARTLTEGKQLELAISGAEQPLPVTVRRLSAAENGKTLIVLRGDAYLSAISMLREQSADLILERLDGLRLPKNALRVSADGGLGVYCRIGRQAWFKPVRILYEGEDDCLVLPGEIDAARESDYIFYTLRAGDEAIISAQDLYNGKVLDGT